MPSNCASHIDPKRTVRDEIRDTLNQTAVDGRAQRINMSSSSPDSAVDPLTPPSIITKVRSNTLDITAAMDRFDLLHKRASSSEARLPSPSEEEDDDTFAGINFTGINSSLSLSSSYDELETPPLPDYSKLLGGGGEESSFPVLRQLQTTTTTTTTTRGSPLQTIESEKCLVDLGVANTKPPKRRPWSASSASSSGGSSLSNSPKYNTRRAGIGGGDGTKKNNKRRHPSPIRRPGHKRDNYSFGSHDEGEGSLISHDGSLASHYSVDAGKHGFLSHAAEAHLRSTEGGGGGRTSRDSSYIDRQNSSDSVISGFGENDSLIFKYNPGKEPPPAEYALPASILKVYGDTELLDDSPISIARKTLSLPSSSLAKTTPTTTTSVDTTVHLLDGKTAKLDAIQLRSSALPTSSLSLNDADDDGPHSSKIRTTHMIALIAGEDDNDDHDDEDNGNNNNNNNMEEQERILPYHERKRLEKLRAAEEKRRERIIAKNSKKKTTTVSIKDNNRVVDIGERSQLNVDTYGYGGIDNNGGNNSTTDVDNNEESTINGLSNNKGWFGGLVALVTSQDGKSSKAKESNDEEEGQLTSNSYREQADAFLRRTERERMMMKESSMRASSFNGCHRARRSTGSSVLVSIASCSDDDDGDCSDDIGDTDDSDDDDDETEESEPSTTPARVWKYGEPPTLHNHTIHSATKRDRIMRRDRLLQEECDYKLHTYKKRHEATSKKFRIFVLISVGIIFVGIMGFAFAVCVRMLMSLQ